MTESHPIHPPYTVPAEIYDRLIWIAVEEQTTPLNALEILTGYYTSVRARGWGLEMMQNVLTLSHELKLRDLAVQDVRLVLAMRRYLADHGLHATMLDQVLELLTLLHRCGLTNRTPEVTALLEMACRLGESAVTEPELERWLARRTKRTER
jgi:hypothetical protein